MKEQTRRHFIRTAAALPAAAAGSRLFAAQEPTRRPNIVYVFADQMRAHALGCYGNLLGHGPWLLYDNQEDPFQLSNLINKPEHAELQARLEKRMRELMKDADDPGDTGKILAYRDARKRGNTKEAQ